MITDEMKILTESIRNQTRERLNNSVPLNSKESRLQTLKDLKQQLHENESIISIKNFFKLTKTQKNFGEVYLYRDLKLEEKVKLELEKDNSYLSLLKNYKNYDNSLIWVDWPQHYAVRILAGNGPFASGKNIFSFFPEALGLYARDTSDVVGLEFIDVWSNIFSKVIFPCVQETFSQSSQIQIYQTLMLDLEKTIYLASVFHEIGHRCGPWKVSPRPEASVKMNSHHWGILGEISTDSLLVQMLSNFPEIAIFVTLQRLFWFGRRGYIENPISGISNEDNDAWLGIYLWNKLRGGGALIKNDLGQLEICNEKIISVYQAITHEIDNLGQIVLKHIDSTEQNQIVQDWMKSKVSWDSQNGFKIPDELKQIFDVCYMIPEIPHFHPPFSLSFFRSSKVNSENSLIYEGCSL